MIYITRSGGFWALFYLLPTDRLQFSMTRKKRRLGPFAGQAVGQEGAEEAGADIKKQDRQDQHGRSPVGDAPRIGHQTFRVDFPDIDGQCGGRPERIQRGRIIERIEIAVVE